MRRPRQILAEDAVARIIGEEQVYKLYSESDAVECMKEYVREVLEDIESQILELGKVGPIKIIDVLATTAYMKKKVWEQ